MKSLVEVEGEYGVAKLVREVGRKTEGQVVTEIDAPCANALTAYSFLQSPISVPFIVEYP